MRAVLPPDKECPTVDALTVEILTGRRLGYFGPDKTTRDTALPDGSGDAEWGRIATPGLALQQASNRAPVDKVSLPC